jgi:hypothetical protein
VKPGWLFIGTNSRFISNAVWDQLRRLCRQWDHVGRQFFYLQLSDELVVLHGLQRRSLRLRRAEHWISSLQFRPASGDRFYSQYVFGSRECYFHTNCRDIDAKR